MSIEKIFTDASSLMTVVSLVTFLGILWWTYGSRRAADFETAANLPFADEPDEPLAQETENRHG